VDTSFTLSSSRLHQHTDIVTTILFCQYYLSEAENGTLTLVPLVVILICILSEALIILLFFSPEVIRSFY